MRESILLRDTTVKYNSNTVILLAYRMSQVWSKPQATLNFISHSSSYTQLNQTQLFIGKTAQTIWILLAEFLTSEILLFPPKPLPNTTSTFLSPCTIYLFKSSLHLSLSLSRHILYINVICIGVLTCFCHVTVSVMALGSMKHSGAELLWFSCFRFLQQPWLEQCSAWHYSISHSVIHYRSHGGLGLHLWYYHLLVAELES